MASGRLRDMSWKPRKERPMAPLSGRIDADDAEWLWSFLVPEGQGPEPVEKSDVLRWAIERAREYYEAAHRWSGRIDALAERHGLTRAHLMARVIELGLAAYEQEAPPADAKTSDRPRRR